MTALRRAAEQDRLLVGKAGRRSAGELQETAHAAARHAGADCCSKLVRDLCRDQGKEAELTIRGEEVTIDKRILEEMKDPLIHLLRNCIDHGIETPEQRRRAGKPPRAAITLAVSPVNGNQVEISVSDDGAGIDVEKVKAAAVKRGDRCPNTADHLSEAAALALVFETDVSTSPMITQRIRPRAGARDRAREDREARRPRRDREPPRLGHDHPHDAAADIGDVSRRAGRIGAAAVHRADCASGAGDALQAARGANGRRPQNPRAERTRRGAGGSRRGAAAAPRLAEAGARRRRPPSWFSAQASSAWPLSVDAVLDEREVLVKRLAKPLSRVRNIAGATVLGSGEVAPILNVADLLKSARTAARRACARHAAARRPRRAPAKRILVVEDSITSRMLLKGILESAGYDVKTAVDGIDGVHCLARGALRSGRLGRGDAPHERLRSDGPNTRGSRRWRRCRSCW